MCHGCSGLALSQVHWGYFSCGCKHITAWQVSFTGKTFTNCNKTGSHLFFFANCVNPVNTTYNQQRPWLKTTDYSMVQPTSAMCHLRLCGWSNVLVSWGNSVCGFCWKNFCKLLTKRRIIKFSPPKETPLYHITTHTTNSPADVSQFLNYW